MKMGMKTAVFLCAVFCAACFVGAAHASEPRIADVQAIIKNGQVRVWARLRHGFGPQTRRDLHNGIPKEFYYYLALKRKQKNWIDEEMLSRTIRDTVRYDLLKKQYTVIRRQDGQAGERDTREETAVWDDFEAMERAVSALHDVALTPVSSLTPGQRYYVDVKAQMKAARLPFYQEFLLFFIPFLEVDTRWSRSGTLRP